MKINDYLFEVDLNAKNDHYIYAIVDPDTLEVRYIGKTINIYIRFSSHLRDARNYNGKANSGNKRLSSWMLSIINESRNPRLFVIDKSDCPATACKKEDHWINYYKNQGARIFNVRKNVKDFPVLDGGLYKI